jgi:hypothetical protein
MQPTLDRGGRLGKFRYTRASQLVALLELALSPDPVQALVRSPVVRSLTEGNMQRTLGW